LADSGRGPEGAQVNREEWQQFLEFGGRAHVRGLIRLFSKLPSSPRCDACGSPFGGLGGRLVDTIVNDAQDVIRAIGYGTTDGPILEVGVGIDVGSAYVGHVGSGDVDDFTVIGDPANTAARLQGIAGSGQIVMSDAIAMEAGLGPEVGRCATIELKGKSETLAVRILTA
jgi:class 3 adenylate cyclase